MLAMGIGNLAFALLMTAYMRGASGAPCLQVWMCARMVFGVTQLLAWARPQGAMPLLAIVESAGWIAGLALEASAYAMFFGYAKLRRHLLPVSGLGLLLACASPLAGVSYIELVVYVAVLLGMGACIVGGLLMRSRADGATALQRLIGMNDMLAGIGLIQFVVVVAGIGIPMLQESLLIAYISGYMLLIVNGFGFILMSKQRDDARMERLATTDELTNVLNRRAFFSRAESARLLALRQRQPIALLMLDIDHFKQLNDRFGHATGDEALTLFARTTGEILREHDILGRMGGEEFALALPGTDLDGAMQAAERLRQATTAIRLLTCGNNYTMTVSIGLVVIEPNEDLPAALARADRGLYAAKRNGRNRVEVGEGIRRAA